MYFYFLASLENRDDILDQAEVSYKMAYLVKSFINLENGLSFFIFELIVPTKNLSSKS